MTIRDLKFSLCKTIPVMFSYVVIGFAFGITMTKSGFNAVWPVLCSLVIYTGAFQFVLVPLLMSEASLPAIFLTCIAMSSRQVFYGLSFIDRFKAMGRRYLYMVFSLTDEVYGIFTTTGYPEDVDSDSSMFLTAVLCHVYWISGTLAGAVLGMTLPFAMDGIDFSMTALFITMTIDQIRKSQSVLPFAAGLVSSAVFLAVLGPDSFMLPSLAASTAAILVFNAKGGRDE